MDEILLAFMIESRFSPNERLTIFLNRIYLGNNQFGLASGTQYYFGCSPETADLPQQALLMGMIASPTRYSLARHPEQALQRRNLILATMVSRGSISVKQKSFAERASLPISVPEE